MYRVRLIAGDWSNDGHGMKEVQIFDVNHSAAELDRAYEEAVKLLGFDPCKDWCHEYEERRIYGDQIEQFKLLGLGYSEYDLDITRRGPHAGEQNLYVKEFWFEIYWAMIRSVIPDLEYKCLSEDGVSEIHIGGYGLYGN
jgi:hypothetical protein